MDSVSSVEVECACDRWHRLSSLLFCGYCSHLRCEGCAELDADAYACPNCFATFSPLNALQNALLCTVNTAYLLFTALSFFRCSTYSFPILC